MTPARETVGYPASDLPHKRLGGGAGTVVGFPGLTFENKLPTGPLVEGGEAP